VRFRRAAYAASAKNMEYAIIHNLPDILPWLEQLVAFDTRNGSGDEMACVEFLRGSLAAHEPDEIIIDTVKRSRGKTDSGYVMARWGNPKVPNPLRMKRDNGRVIGLGTSDIKGAAACILGAMETAPPKDVAILFSGDEEHGSEVMPAIIERGHYGGAKSAIVCEPTCCEVGRRHRGMLAMNALFTGKGGHSSLSDVTERPLLQAARLATAWGDYGDVHRGFGNAPYEGLCLNIGDIENDGAYNVIPTRSKLWVSMRPPPGDNVAKRRADMLKIAYVSVAHLITAAAAYGKALSGNGV